MSIPTNPYMTKNAVKDPNDQEQRLADLENQLYRLDNDVQNLTMLLTEVNLKLRSIQEFALKIGQAQNNIHEYITHWPFIRVVKRDKHGKDIS
jgi:hypothetical protein